MMHETLQAKLARVLKKIQRRKEARQGRPEVLFQSALQKDGGQELHQPLRGHLK